MNDIPVDIRQTEIPAAVAIGQLLVVESKEVQDCRVQVVNVDLFLNRLRTELVGRAVDVTALHSAAGHP